MQMRVFIFHRLCEDFAGFEGFQPPKCNETSTIVSAAGEDPSAYERQI